jgi:YHS domain-containing protein
MTKNNKLIAIFGILVLALVLAAAAQQKSDDKAIDPVCGMTVVKANAAATFEYKGMKYYFCSPGCKDAFAKDPEKFLQKKTAKEEPKDVLLPAPGHQGMGGQMHVKPLEGQKPMAQAGCPMMGGRMAMRHGGPMGMMAGPMGPGVNRLLLRRDVDWTFEKTADGVTVKIVSKDPETVKAIQERLAKMKEMKETMTAPAAAESAASSCPCPNCPMKEKVKK